MAKAKSKWKFWRDSFGDGYEIGFDRKKEKCGTFHRPVGTAHTKEYAKLMASSPDLAAALECSTLLLNEILKLVDLDHSDVSPTEVADQIQHNAGLLYQAGVRK